MCHETSELQGSPIEARPFGAGSSAQVSKVVTIEETASSTFTFTPAPAPQVSGPESSAQRGEESAGAEKTESAAGPSTERRRRHGPRLFQRSIALALLVLSAPLFLLISLAVWTSDGSPIFYRGVRLGRKREPFTMLKFRTLRVDANRVIGSQLLNHTHDLAIRGGRFLRDTRLDELPQIWNVLRGDMSFIGPRPERLEVYRARCRNIPNYEQRFQERPGLIGIAQLCTPHGTDKRYRTLIDNAAIRRRKSQTSALGIVVYTITVVLGRAFLRSAQHLYWDLFQKRLLGRYCEERKLRRVSPPAAVAWFLPQCAEFPLHARVLDMNEHAMLIACDGELGETRALEVRLDLPLARRDGRRRICNARCQAHVTQLRHCRGLAAVVLEYRPSTPRSHYMIHQYFLRASLASPPSTPLRLVPRYAFLGRSRPGGAGASTASVS